MDQFKIFTGTVAPLNKDNIDTDAIIPKQYLKSIHRTGFGVNLFDEWRYLDVGEPGMDHSKRRKNKNFVLNKKPYDSASILLTGKNFGCGSSREHAAWALSDFGFKAIISESFADIFYNNCFKNGILPIELDQQDVDKLTFDAENKKKLTINLEEQLILRENGKTINYKIDAFRKKCLLEGLDDIGLTFQKLKKIDIYEEQLSKSYPWII